jgi:hypothetical protein
MVIQIRKRLRVSATLRSVGRRSLHLPQTFCVVIGPMVVSGGDHRTINSKRGGDSDVVVIEENGRGASEVFLSPTLTRAAV